VGDTGDMKIGDSQKNTGQL